MRRMRRSTVRVSSVASAIVTQSDAEKIDERGDHAEGGEDRREPRLGSEQFVHSPPPDEAEADGDGKHPADGRGIEQLLHVAALDFFFAVIVRHAEESPRARQPSSTSASPDSPTATAPRPRSM